MKKQTAINWADKANVIGSGTFWADIIDGKWCILNVFRRFYSIAELKKYLGKKTV